MVVRTEQARQAPLVPAGLDPAQLSYVLTVMRDCFKAGIDVSKIAAISHLLAHNHQYVYECRSSYQDLMPFLKKVLVDEIKFEIDTVEYD